MLTPKTWPDGGTWSDETLELASLVEQAARGCAEAFEQLYLRTARRLLYSLRRWVDERDAEDVLADVYLQVWLTACKYDRMRASPTVWMSMIAKSRALDHLRRRRREVRCEDSGDSLVMEDNPETLCSQAQRRQLAHSSLDRAGLGPTERQMLCMAYFADNSHREIAQATGMPLGTVKTTMRRAQIKLRDFLHAEGAEQLAVERAQ